MTTLTDRCDEAMARKMCAAARPSVDPDDLTPAPRGIMGLVPKWTMYQHLASAARLALLSELDAEGWHVVPSHPDRQMQTAGSSAIIKAIELARRENGGDIEETLHCNDVYKPMLAAAPQPFPEDKP